MAPRYKLVRDKIPNIIRKEGQTPHIRTVHGRSYNRTLFKKLQEEVDELSKALPTKEVADVLEVVHALCAIYGISFKDVERVRVAKARKRGGFSQGIMLEQV